MNRTQKTDEQLAALASHLSLRRAAILQAWREAVNADRELSAPSSLPRTQFNDHIPELLDAFEKSLRICSHQERIATTEEEKEDAAGHGLQRWQQGYHLREVTREWGHLQLCLVSELEEYSTAHTTWSRARCRPPGGAGDIVQSRCQREYHSVFPSTTGRGRRTPPRHGANAGRSART